MNQDSDKKKIICIWYVSMLFYLGITNSTLSKFKSTGKFVCEKEGLYLIASNIISNKSGSSFKIVSPMNQDSDKNNLYLVR
jgi:hypothetical protein